MDTFISRKRRRTSEPVNQDFPPPTAKTSSHTDLVYQEEDESTDVKLAILSSLYPHQTQSDLLEILLNCDGSVQQAREILSASLSNQDSPRKKSTTAVGTQSALPYISRNGGALQKSSKLLTKKGKTLHLYTPGDIAAHTPCSIVHNFLPTDLANSLLREILPEVTTYTSASFKLFDNIVSSPHTACFYVDTEYDADRQRHEYLYNGSSLSDVRPILPFMRQVSKLVREAVNAEIAKRIRIHYPEGKKLKYQTPLEWQPNAAFVNCYDGGAQSVGYHADQLTYLGPRPVIGSLSLGVAREFRVRKIVPPDEDDNDNDSSVNPDNNEKAKINKELKIPAGDQSGQIAIHLPHNSLVVMHAEMQEEWKHSIAPALSIDPHPIAGNKRINITYRWYRDEFHPRNTPKCRCGVATVLKCVQRKRANRGKYMWMCQVGNRADLDSTATATATVTSSATSNSADTGRDDISKAAKAIKPSGSGGCGFFEWAEFTDDGMPIWKHKNPLPAAAIQLPTPLVIQSSGDAIETRIEPVYQPRGEE